MKQKLALACTLVHEPRSAAARRADDRRRSGVAPRVLEAAVRVPRQRPDDRDGDAVPGRGRALRARRAAARGPAAGARRARRAAGDAATAGWSRSSPRRRGRRSTCSRAVAGVEDVQAFGDRAHVRVGAAAQAVTVDRIRAALRARGIGVVSVRPVAATLEDVFIDLISRDGAGASATRRGAVMNVTQAVEPWPRPSRRGRRGSCGSGWCVAGGGYRRAAGDRPGGTDAADARRGDRAGAGEQPAARRAAGARRGGAGRR